jgi:IS5 family transposase
MGLRKSFQGNKQLEKHKIIVKKGTIVDISKIDSLLKPKGQTTFEIENDSSEEEQREEDKYKENSHHLEIT